MGEDSVAMEAALTILWKLGALLAAPFIGHLYIKMRDEKKEVNDRLSKLEDTRLTREQTIEQIEFRMKPLEIKMDHYSAELENNTKALKEFTEVLRGFTLELTVVQQQLLHQKEKK